jgi:hypothetical protein
MRNWEPISLERVCQIAQCPKNKAACEGNSVKNGESSNKSNNHIHSSGSSASSDSETDSEFDFDDEDDENEHESGEASHEQDKANHKNCNGDLVKNRRKWKSKNLMLKSSDNDSTTVYEIMSHVLSFSSIIIKVTLK